MTKLVYSTTEIAQEQGVSREAVQQWLRAEKLKGQKSGRDWIVLYTDYEDFKKGYPTSTKDKE